MGELSISSVKNKKKGSFLAQGQQICDRAYTDHIVNNSHLVPILR